MINVTKTFLPCKERYLSYVDEIYNNNWITNNGPMVRRLEKRLAEYLGVKNIVLVANGTVALEIAYRTLDLRGYAVTTPFSFVATTSSLVTNNLSPIFADIDPLSLNIDTDAIRASITPNTSAIVPVHVFGNGCDVEEIEKISKEYGIKVIYDSAHAFGVKYKGKSILSYGDISTLSFHATKLFHTIEGGALIINDDSLVEKARFLINFGIDGPDSVKELGTNAKMNEFEAAMGLAMLDEMDVVMAQREACYHRYYQGLKGFVGFQSLNIDCETNFSYFPIIFKTEDQMLQAKKALNVLDIAPRRYFYPSLDTLDYIEPKQYCPNSRDISSRILCLPMGHDVSPEISQKIIQVVLDNVK